MAAELSCRWRSRRGDWPPACRSPEPVFAKALPAAQVQDAGHGSANPAVGAGPTESGEG
jgi:hypothetical protein